jgi:CO/xanthine dehydrogenase Mo-binding subunit
VTTTYERNVVLATKTYDVVGTRPIRHDGADKVTGRAQYGADFSSTGALYGKILRSPHAHARVKSIDTSKAEALPGILAAVTAKDLPTSGADDIVEVAGAGIKAKYARERILAHDKVLFKGHPVAAVAAVSVHIAEEALALIDVEYEVLPTVLDTHEALKEDAPLLHDDLFTEEFGETLDKPSNLAQHFRHEKGDIDKGFAEADVIVEREFNTSTVHQGYIEPHACTVEWNKDGRIYIWSSTQAPFEIRDSTASVLGLPVSQVRLTPLEIGGGFGGKWEPYGEPVAALLSKKTGRPVKIVLTRTEEFECTGPTPGSYIKLKMGATKEGKITAAYAYMAYEAGLHPGSMVDAGTQCVFAPYDIPNAVVDGLDVVVNKPKTAAYRAPGSTHAAFAAESVVNELAEKLGMDPLEFRMLNAAREGTRRADGPRFPRIGCQEVIRAMMGHPHYKAPLEGPNRGRGVALGFWFNAGLQSSVTISVNSDGTATLVEGSPDIGGTRTSIAMQAAEALGIPAEDVQPSVVNTDEVGFTAGTGGSRVTFATGYAAHEAAQDVKRLMIDRAALIWDVDADSVEMEHAVIKSKADPELSMTFKELAGQLNDTGGPVVGRATVDPKGEGGAFAGNIVDIEVDPETGKVDILRFTVVQDAGKAIHPSYVEGQMQGGSVQGIGWALNEEYFMTEDGVMANSTMLDYRMPISLDLPMIDTVIVEVANPGHPYGVRGVGEVPICPPPPALADAIYHAVGVRMDRLPMNPGAIMEASWEKDK